MCTSPTTLMCTSRTRAFATASRRGNKQESKKKKKKSKNLISYTTVFVGRWSKLMGSQWHHVQRCFKNLARFVRTVSVTLSRGCRGRYTGPQRVSLSDAMDDVAWLRERCKAQSKTQAERTHVVQLVQALSHNSSSGPRVVRPDVPAVPLDVLPALSEIAVRPLSRVSFISSQMYVGAQRCHENIT